MMVFELFCFYNWVRGIKQFCLLNVFACFENLLNGVHGINV